MVEMARIGEELARVGLITRGGFLPIDEDQVPEYAEGAVTKTIVLAGNAGPAMWAVFSRARAQAGQPLSLDNWTREVLTPIAEALGARLLFPFGGPPFQPFLRWARRAESVHPSPIGPLIHPRYGLWHAYRGAFLFPEALALPSIQHTASPCDSCADRPCLSRCPVDALSPGHYQVETCREHLLGAIGNPCLSAGCLARHACPVGADFKYAPEQAGFHMRAFSISR